MCKNLCKLLRYMKNKKVGVFLFGFILFLYLKEIKVLLLYIISELISKGFR